MKSALWGEADRLRRQGSSQGGGGASSAQIEMFQQNLEELREENRRLKAGGARVDVGEGTKSRSGTGGTGGQKYGEMVQEFESKIESLNNEKRVRKSEISLRPLEVSEHALTASRVFCLCKNHLSVLSSTCDAIYLFITSIMDLSHGLSHFLIFF
jgi:hypothetical protein